MIIGLTKLQEPQESDFEDINIRLVLGRVGSRLIFNVYIDGKNKYTVRDDNKAFRTLVELCKLDSECKSVDREYILGDYSKEGFFTLRNTTDLLGPKPQYASWKEARAAALKNDD